MDSGVLLLISAQVIYITRYSTVIRMFVVSRLRPLTQYLNNAFISISSAILFESSAIHTSINDIAFCTCEVIFIMTSPSWTSFSWQGVRI